MVGALRYPYDKIVDVDMQRWEIELGFREMKQGLHQSKTTLRSKKPEMVRQELWGLLLAYNLIRIAMLDAVKEIPELSASRLSFSLCMRQVVTFFMTIMMRSAGRLPSYYAELLESLRIMKLSDKEKMPVSLTDWH